MTLKEFLKLLVKKCIGTTDISGVGDGTLKGAISSLNSNLIADDTPFRFGKDDDGNYGYIITDEDGADSVVPFRNSNCQFMSHRHYTGEENLWVNILIYNDKATYTGGGINGFPNGSKYFRGIYNLPTYTIYANYDGYYWIQYPNANLSRRYFKKDVAIMSFSYNVDNHVVLAFEKDLNIG
jgi:hypothetical protein